MQETVLLNVLQNYSALTALVPASKIVAEPFPQGTAAPAISFKRVTHDQQITFDGPTESPEHGNYEIRVFADTYRNSKLISEAVFNALSAASASTLVALRLSEQDDYTPIPEVFVLLAHYSVWTP